MGKAGMAGIASNAVEAVCREVPEVQRRLGSDSRRLATGSIEYSYRISMPTEQAAIALIDEISSKSHEDLAELIQSNLPDGSTLAVKVVGQGTPAMIMVTMTTTTTAEVDELDDSHAHARVAFSSLVSALLSSVLALLLQ